MWNCSLFPTLTNSAQRSLWGCPGKLYRGSGTILRTHGPGTELSKLLWPWSICTLVYIWTPTLMCNRNKNLPELPLTTCIAFYFGFYVSLKNAGWYPSLNSFCITLIWNHWAVGWLKKKKKKCNIQYRIIGTALVTETRLLLLLSRFSCVGLCATP